MNATKRDILLALAAVATTAALPTRALAQDLDLSAGGAIGAAYLAANPATDLAALRAALVPSGFTAQAGERLQARARADFGAGRVFKYKGWRMSETEARLFALLARA